MDFKYKIIYIENDVFFAKLYAKHFVNNKINIVFARDVKTALTKLNLEKDIELVLLNSELSNSIEEEMINKIRSINKKIPIIILSSCGDKKLDGEKYKKLGVVDYVEKAFVAPKDIVSRTLSFLKNKN